MKHPIYLVTTYLIASVLCIAVACAEPKHSKSHASQPLTLASFKQIKEGQPFAEIRARFGEPEKDVGSGIHIYQYNLDDGTYIWVGCVEKVLYVDHVESGKPVRLVGKKI